MAADHRQLVLTVLDGLIAMLDRAPDAVPGAVEQLRGLRDGLAADSALLALPPAGVHALLAAMDASLAAMRRHPSLAGLPDDDGPLH